MNTLRRTLAITAIILGALFIVMKIRGDEYLLKGLWATYLHGNVSATIDDARFFKTHNIATGSNTWDWPLSASYNKREVPAKLKTTLANTGSVAFLIVQNDSILTEQYWDKYSDSMLSNSFSMAKNITTLLAQIAIQKKVLTGWHQKVTTLLPELKGAYAAQLELWHLSSMSSGLDWNEDYSNPWAITAKTYYCNHLREVMLSLPIKDEPGKFFNYQSGSTELLAMCLMKATGKSLAELTSEWLWKPMQAKHDATWHTDDEGTEMAWCCYNSNARDFARFGKLMINQGNWNGKQILDSAFVQMATTSAVAPYYGYSFWLDNIRGTKVFFQWGFCGEYIIAIPEYNLVIVRLGKEDLPETKDHLSEYVRVLTDATLEMVTGK